MKIVYLIDKDCVGGGGEYIRQLRLGLDGFETQVLYADEKQCRARNVNSLCPDVIHVNHLKALLQLYVNPFCRPCAPVVFTVHGIHVRKYMFARRRFLDRLRFFLRVQLERYLYRQVRCLIALTRTDAEMIRHLYGDNLDIRVVPNGVLPQNDGNDTCADVKGVRPYFLMIARMDFQKGVDILLKAVAMEQENLRALCRTVLIIGGGGILEDMRGLAKSLGVCDIVRFAGEMPQASRYLSCGRILVSPSRWEGLPMLLLEAGLAKMPVIASDCPGNRDVVESGSTGWIFPTEDAGALSRLLVSEYDDETLRRMGEGLYRHVIGHFSISGMLCQTKETYKSIVQCGRR